MTELRLLIQESVDRCGANSAGRRVVVLQDSTELDYTAITGKLKSRDPDIGSLDSPGLTGFFLHPALVLDRKEGIPLGYSSIHLYQRPFDQQKKKVRNYNQQPIEEKESHKWLLSAKESKTNLASAAHVLLISDRESDIYAYLSTVPDERTDVLIRVRHDRSISANRYTKLFEQLTHADWLGGMVLEVKDNPKRQSRLAHLGVRAEKVQIDRPRERREKDLPLSCTLWAIEIQEIPQTIPAGEPPIHWRLLTSEPCQNLEAVQEMARLYAMRWWIEQLFRTLKLKGLQMESSQLEKGIRLKKLTVIALQVALSIMMMVQNRENSLNLPAKNIFSQKELQFLALLIQTLEGKTQKQQNPYPPQSLAWATWAVARLGGWKGYTSESPPGIVSLCRGLKEFKSQFRGWRIAQNLSPP